jgi:hypothetical protein
MPATGLVSLFLTVQVTLVLLSLVVVPLNPH